MLHTKIAVLGANGRMGKNLIEACHLESKVALTAAIVRENSAWLGLDVGVLCGLGELGVVAKNDLNSVADEVDVVIDFTLPAALESNLDWCVTHNKSIVIGTTGLNDQQQAALASASEQIPVLFSANYSVGVNLLLNLVRQASRTLGQSADIEIIEAHHKHKVDAPSGTALAIGEAIADELGSPLNELAVYSREGYTGEREAGKIGFATVRGGDIVGEHTALFAEIGERLEITHKASSRMTFAKGAVRGAQWLVEQPPGLYDMRQVLGLT